MTGVHLRNIPSPILLQGGDRVAYRDPTAIYHNGLFRLFYTLTETEPDGSIYMYTATSHSEDLVNWTEPRKLTPRDQSLNFSSPGNIIRFGDRWIMCLQTYPRQYGEKYGNASARIWIMESDDLDAWSEPELLRLKGDNVPVEDMGRMIDPYLIESKDEPGKWFCFYKQNGVSMSYSYDLKRWTYYGHEQAGENVCILPSGDEYVMFHSPENGIGMKRSSDLMNWTDDETLLTLGQSEWEWAQGRITAGFALDCREVPGIGKYLMFYHGSGPEDEQTLFDTQACIGVAWSDDLTKWEWPSNTNAGAVSVWKADRGDGTYRNPILFADYSDLDVIRVEHDFYMVASSFNHTPVLPVLHSRDLVNWTIIGHVAERIEEPGFERVRHGEGVWAPSIRYHDGKYWVFFGMPDEGLFMSTAGDPRGPWSPLHCVKRVKGWIDCCPYWDDDGQAYLIHAYAASRCGIKDKLNLCRMAPDGRALLDEGIIVFDGTERHPTLEGPKLYKRDGWYYIFAPAGGVKTGWQTVLRSRSIYGPYEDRIVLHQGESAFNGPHQGGFVELESGESWFLHFQDRDAYGRIVHLQPMRWVGGWPEMGEDRNGDGIGEPVEAHRKPNVGRTYPVQAPQMSDEFMKNQLGLQWQWQANVQPDWYSLTAAPGSLRLFAVSLPKDSGGRLYRAPNILMQKFPAERFVADTKLTLTAQNESARTGLIIFGEDYAYLSVCKGENGRYRLSYVQGAGGRKREEWEWTVSAVDLNGPDVYLRVSVSEGAICRFAYAQDGSQFVEFDDTFAAQPGVWVGAKVGLFAVSAEEAKQNAGYSEFAYFHISKSAVIAG
ncbi:family 43 glycosylhydrolase [Cohnella sp. GbtcB17]|uniref:family 43 glycosylhydrolase n=1 Tax=Cohnella sp. GbtcB17 TaxID=2824762 RepID=UPI0027D21874|nr:family 43 glycosylhydrolase [Cohnella sp. GbtcB17]